jgi:hypothetical protein
MGDPMNFANLRSKSSLIVLSAAVSAMLVATDAAAQRRGGGGGGRPGGGGRMMGQGVPRGPVVRGGGSRVVGAPFRSSYYRPYYRSYYRPYFRPGISLGFYAGYPFYGYGYYGYPYAGYYSRPYGYYGYPYGYPAGYGYGYGNGYGYGSGYGGVRIEGAPGNAEVLADGYYVGVVDDFDGSFQRLELEPGAHSIEIRMQGMPPTVFDVNIQPGRTVTFHVR